MTQARARASAAPSPSRGGAAFVLLVWLALLGATLYLLVGRLGH